MIGHSNKQTDRIWITLVQTQTNQIKFRKNVLEKYCNVLIYWRICKIGLKNIFNECNVILEIFLTERFYPVAIKDIKLNKHIE